jgi:type I restriction enzyme M protein
MIDNGTTRLIYHASYILNRVIKKNEQADYILPLIFLKYISDFRRGKSHKKYSAWRLDSVCKYDWLHQISIDYYDLYDSRYIINLDVKLNNAIRDIHTSDSELNNVFQSSDYTTKRLGEPQQRNALLRALIECLAEATLEDLESTEVRSHRSSPLSNALEALVSAKGTSIRSTPESVSHLVAELVNPQDGDRIYDPACGSGGLLLACSRFLNSQGNVKLCGVENHWSSWVAAKMNFFLSCKDSEEIKLGTPLETPTFVDSHGEPEKFDVVVSNFPWESKDWRIFQDHDQKAASSKASSRSNAKGDYWFIQHMLSSTNQKNGRMAALVSNGALSRGGEEAKIRRELVEKNLIDAVISLPDKLLFDTTKSSAILFLRYGKKTDDVLFIDAKRSKDGTSIRGEFNEAMIAHTIDLYRNRKCIAYQSQVSSVLEISENNFDLNVQRYISTLEEDEDDDLELSKLKREQAKIYQELKLLDLEIKGWLEKIGD